MLDFIRRQILRYRDLLANLSRKNKELYYKQSIGHCINLVKPPTLDKQNIQVALKQFKPLRTNSDSFQNLLNTASLDLSTHFLLDETNNAELIKKLDKIRLADNKFESEYGVSGAWLLGPFLCWRDCHEYKQEEMLVSPLFKLPVDIKKNKRKHWELKLSENALQINPSLKLALRQKWGIHLPDEIETDNVQVALQKLISCFEKCGKSIIVDKEYDTTPKIPPKYKSIKDENGVETHREPINIDVYLSEKDLALYNQTTSKDFVLLDVLVIDHLNASRTVLLKDYDTILEQEDTHPILQALFTRGAVAPNHSNAQETSSLSEKLKELDSYKERENYFVVNIDSSQHRAINKAAKNLVVVIQGPPGTGKSQTITNLIAESLARGKRVLFVSEKRAALDVVYSRLQKAELASQAVLIHSSDLNKQSLYNSFLELSDSVHDESKVKSFEKISNEFDKLKSEINRYYEVLETKHNQSDLSISELLLIASQITLEEQINIELAKMFENYSYDDLINVCAMLDVLQDKTKKINNLSNHPWINRRKETILTESFSQQFSKLIEDLKLSEQSLLNIQHSLSDLGVKNINAIPSDEIINNIISYPINEKWIDFVLCAFDKNHEESIQSIKHFEKIILLIQNGKKYFNLFNNESNIESIKKLYSYYSQPHDIFEVFKPFYWKMRNLRNQCLKNWDGSSLQFKGYIDTQTAVDLFSDLSLNNHIPKTEAMDQLNHVTEACRISLKYTKDIKYIKKTMKEIGMLQNEKFRTVSVGTIKDIKNCFQEISIFLNKYKNCRTVISQKKKELNKYFEIDIVAENDNENVLIYENLINSIQDIDLIDQIDLYLDKVQPLMKTTLTKNILADKFVIIKTQWGSVVLSSVVKLWMDDVFSKYPDLRSFDQSEFAAKINRFKDLENKHRVMARHFVNNTISERWKKGEGESLGLHLLKKESNKQRKVLAPREIMENGALSTMLKLKPCWLMSPLSISQMLPLTKELFETIIFDEASQVRVEDAIPSIYRAKTMIVVGDPKQMPPTNFFSASAFADDDEDEETELTTSILDLASQIYPTELLEWHYRSRAESLIAFSNRAFYGGELIAAPNPNLITEGDAIKFHQIENAYFQSKYGNSTEAKAVVDRLLFLLETSPAKSYGIIAMGQSQMQMIEDTLEETIISSTKYQALVEKIRSYSGGEGDSSLFIKNLENVQGDERDIILISTGYAPSSPGKKLLMNFGPLHKPGGSRRLNVAITRAKENIEIFCSFDPNSIDTDESAFARNPDLALFGRYLKYAKAISEKNELEARKILDCFGITGIVTNRKSSNFSKDVKRRLEEIGYIVSEEIGSSKFFVDLGVHHPVIPTNFVLGIECDGAFFHSSPYARDRDKIRQELLESRGWKITRIWSQDWSKNWKVEIDRIDNILKSIINN